MFVVGDGELELETLSGAAKEIGKCQRIGAAADSNDDLLACFENLMLQTAIDKSLDHDNRRSQKY